MSDPALEPTTWLILIVLALPVLAVVVWVAAEWWLDERERDL